MSLSPWCLPGLSPAAAHSGEADGDPIIPRVLAKMEGNGSPPFTYVPSSTNHLIVVAMPVCDLALTRHTESLLSADSREPRSTIVKTSLSRLTVQVGPLNGGFGPSSQK